MELVRNLIKRFRIWLKKFILEADKKEEFPKELAQKMMGKPVRVGSNGPIVGEVTLVAADGSYGVLLSEEGKAWVESFSGNKAALKFVIDFDSIKEDQ